MSTYADQTICPPVLPSRGGGNHHFRKSAHFMPGPISHPADERVDQDMAKITRQLFIMDTNKNVYPTHSTYASMVSKKAVPKPPVSRSSAKPIRKQPRVNLSTGVVRKPSVGHHHHNVESFPSCEPTTSSTSSMPQISDEISQSHTLETTEDSEIGKWLPSKRDQRNRTLFPSHKVQPLKTSTSDKSSTTKKTKTKMQYKPNCRSSSAFLEFSYDSSVSFGDRRYDNPVLLNFKELLKSSKIVSVDKHKPLVPPVQVLKSVPEFKPVGKVREQPRVKRLSRLKRSILNSREIRKLRRCTSAPPKVDVELICSTSTPNVPALCPRRPHISNSETKTEEIHEFYQPLQHDPLKPNLTQDDLVSSLLQNLAEFQDRAYTKYANAPYYRNRSRRFVCGIREVMKHLRLKHTKLVLLARDLEANASRYYTKLRATTPHVTAESNASTDELSPLEQSLFQIWQLAFQSDPVTPILIAHSRRKLARLCHKPNCVSVIAILSVAGAEPIAKELFALNSGINLPLITDGADASKCLEESNRPAG